MDSSRLLGHRLNNAVHAALLLGGLGGLLVLIGWVLDGPAGMLWVGLLGVAGLLFTPRISPALVLRLYKARPIAPVEAPPLYDWVTRLAAQAGVPVAPVLYYVPTPVMNAFSVGRPSEAVIAVTDGLLRGLPPRELHAVLAHEIGHIRHNDMWLMALADAVSRIVRVMAFTGQVLILFNLPMLLMQTGTLPWLPLILLLLAPTLSALLQLALSRNREFDADVEAAHLTGDPQGLAQALVRMEAQQERFWHQLVWPGYRNRQPSLLRTHPNSEARIARLRTMAPAGQGFATPETHFAVDPSAWDFPAHRPRHRWHGLWY